MYKDRQLVTHTGHYTHLYIVTWPVCCLHTYTGQIIEIRNVIQPQMFTNTTQSEHDRFLSGISQVIYSNILLMIQLQSCLTGSELNIFGVKILIQKN